jgi:hypothetical protein
MRSTLLLGRWVWRAMLVAVVLAPRYLASQAPLVEHPLVFDMKIALPAGWASDSIPGLRALVDRFYDGSQPLTEERVQSLAADFQRTPLLRARNPQRQADQAIVVFTLIPGFHVREFEASAQELAGSLVASHCDANRGIVERAGGTMSCDRHEVREVGGRPSVVIFGAMKVDANGIDNHRTVVLMPVDGGLLSFTLSVHRTEADTTLAERVIDSIRGPGR